MLFEQNGEPIRFWLALGPWRKQVKDLIMAHGGYVADVQFRAHYILADDKTMDKNKDSFSYVFVQECVLVGQLLNLEPFRLSKNNPNRVDQTRPRMPYTAEEDVLLEAFLWSKPRTSWAGVNIYKEFAQTHTEHTFQSWKERAKKRLIPRLASLPDRTLQTDPEEPALKRVKYARPLQPQPTLPSNLPFKHSGPNRAFARPIVSPLRPIVQRSDDIVQDSLSESLSESEVAHSESEVAHSESEVVHDSLPEDNVAEEVENTGRVSGNVGSVPESGQVFKKNRLVNSLDDPFLNCPMDPMTEFANHVADYITLHDLNPTDFSTAMYMTSGLLEPARALCHGGMEPNKISKEMRRWIFNEREDGLLMGMNPEDVEHFPNYKNRREFLL